MTTASFAIAGLVIIGLILIIASGNEMLRRIACAYAMLDIYRNLSTTPALTMDLADEIIFRSHTTPLLRKAFHIGRINRGRILIMLDTLDKLGFAEKHEQPSRAIEQARTRILSSLERIIDTGPAQEMRKQIRDIENQLKAIGVGDTVWRKKYRGNAPKPNLKDFLIAHD